MIVALLELKGKSRLAVFLQRSILSVVAKCGIRHQGQPPSNANDHMTATDPGTCAHLHLPRPPCLQASLFVSAGVDKIRLTGGGADA